LPAVSANGASNWRDFGTSRWQLSDNATSIVRRVEGHQSLYAR